MASIFKRGGKENRDGRYRVSYFDEFGRRKDVSTGTSDKDAARQIAAKLETDVALRRRGVITPQEDKLATLNAKSVADHVSDYLAHCGRQNQDDVHVGNKETQLNLLLASTSAKVLGELSRDKVQRHLDDLADLGKSARTVNQHRTTIATFVGWCYAGVGVHQNPLAKMPRLNEAADQRLVRRALTEDELARLVAVPEAIAAGRAGYYIVVTLAGLRSGDAKQITWDDVDLDAGTLRIRLAVNKSRREDHLPLHPQVIELLQRIRPALAKATESVFHTIPRVKTFHHDCRRAGIERYDGEGRQLDLHALGRTTFGTRLAKSGIMPQMAAKLMRHTDVKITMKHYTKLRMHDEQQAVAELPQIVPAVPKAVKATGTDSVSVSVQQSRQQSCGLKGHPVAPSGAINSAEVRSSPVSLTGISSSKIKGFGTIGQPVASTDWTSDADAANLLKTGAIGAVG